jgi:hypothetical protein
VTHPPASFLEGPVQSLIIVHAGDSAKSTPKIQNIKILILDIISYHIVTPYPMV